MRGIVFFVALFGAAVALTWGATAQAADKVALVVGNGHYANANTLPNPPNDAVDIAAALKTIGFTVVVAADVDKVTFDQKLREFAHALRGAHTALFFYAGHGMQVAGKNYAIPVDARLETAADLQVETVDIDDIIAMMQSDENRVNLVFLDACRNNPLTRSFARNLPATRSASVGAGLSALEAGRGTLIAFATAPNTVALDGDGRNSPFTTALLKHIGTPGLDIAFVMRRVTADVEAASGGRQVPWMHASLTSDVVLAPGPAAPGPAGPSADEVAWSFVKHSKDLAQVRRFLEQFPDSALRPDAQARLAMLKDAAATRQSAEPSADSSARTQQASLNVEPTLVAEFGDWGAYTAIRAGNKICFAGSMPVRSEPRDANRDQIFLSVLNEPATGTTNELSMILGLPLEPGVDASAEISDTVFPLWTKDDTAWIKSVGDETRMIDAMRAGARMQVKATSTSGNRTVDYYSLRGVTKAIERAAQVCQ